MILDFRFYFKLLVRRFPVMALLFILCAGLGAYSAARLPEKFQSSARLIVVDPEIPEWMVSTTVQTGEGEQLDIIQQRLITRANLIDIANKFEVYDDLREVHPDVIFNRMQRETQINRSAGRDRATLLSISFTGRSGQIAANVVNEYVTLVLEANTDFRINQADGPLAFFEQEVERLAAALDEQNLRITTFKSANSDALPENQPYRLGRQSLLQERLSQLERDLRTNEAQRSDIEKIFQTTGQIGRVDNRRPISSEERQLLVAKTDLEIMLTTYSAQNPRVIRLQSVVDRLEAIVATQQTALDDTLNPGSEEITAEEALFQATMTEIDNRIESIAFEIERTKTELDSIQASTVASSANGIQLNALERDFENIQNQYNTAVGNLNESKVSERIEATGQGRRITIIESANIPNSPSGPNRPRIVIMGAAVGLGLAGGFFFLLELLNRTIRRPAEMVGKFGITPITTIPYMESRGRRFARRSFLISLSLVALIGGPLALWYIDTHYMPLDLLVRQVLAKLNIG